MLPQAAPSLSPHPACHLHILLLQLHQLARGDVITRLSVADEWTGDMATSGLRYVHTTSQVLAGSSYCVIKPGILALPHDCFGAGDTEVNFTIHIPSPPSLSSSSHSLVHASSTHNPYSSFSPLLLPRLRHSCTSARLDLPNSTGARTSRSEMMER